MSIRQIVIIVIITYRLFIFVFGCLLWLRRIYCRFFGWRDLHIRLMWNRLLGGLVLRVFWDFWFVFDLVWGLVILQLLWWLSFLLHLVIGVLGMNFCQLIWRLEHSDLVWILWFRGQIWWAIWWQDRCRWDLDLRFDVVVIYREKTSPRGIWLSSLKPWSSGRYWIPRCIVCRWRNYSR